MRIGLWEMKSNRSYDYRFQDVKRIAHALLRALAYLHDAGVVHTSKSVVSSTLEHHSTLIELATDLTIWSCLLGPPVDRVLEKFVQTRHEKPPLDLSIGGYPTMHSVCGTVRGKPPSGDHLPITVLGDLDNAVFGKTEYSKEIQRPIYRAPEVARNRPWNSKADIWNLGALVLVVVSAIHKCGFRTDMKP